MTVGPFPQVTYMPHTLSETPSLAQSALALCIFRKKSLREAW